MPRPIAAISSGLRNVATYQAFDIEQTMSIQSAGRPSFFISSRTAAEKSRSACRSDASRSPSRTVRRPNAPGHWATRSLRMAQ